MRNWGQRGDAVALRSRLATPRAKGRTNGEAEEGERETKMALARFEIRTALLCRDRRHQRAVKRAAITIITISARSDPGLAALGREGPMQRTRSALHGPARTIRSAAPLMEKAAPGLAPPDRYAEVRGIAPHRAGHFGEGSGDGAPVQRPAKFRFGTPGWRCPCWRPARNDRETKAARPLLSKDALQYVLKTGGHSRW